MIGAMAHFVANGAVGEFVPMNANFGIVEPLGERIKGGKVARVNAVSPAIESGHVYLPKGEPWVSTFVDQFTAFPASKNDDMVDSASQALSYLLYASGDVPKAEVKPSLYEQETAAMLDGDQMYDIYNQGGF